jgi:paraquat-inducible protein B
MEPAPVFKEKKGISPVWILPILALCICAWIIYTSYQNAGVSITVYFADASGITPGKTQVIARGVPVGTVSEIQPELSNRRVKTVVQMDQSVADLLVEVTLFWVVRPQVSAASVEGLDTLLSGSYIGIQPGTSSKKAQEFTGISSPPPIPKETPGLHIRLRAEKLGSIQNGSEVYYRNVSIGSVTKHTLDQQNDSIIIDLFIQPEYSYLVKEGSRFYNASGINIRGKLTNLDIQVESLASLIRGGIVLHTPEQLKNTPTVTDGEMFTLFEDFEAARHGIKMTLQLASSQGISEGKTQVIYRGLVAGVVEKIDFNNDPQQSVTAQIMLDPRAERILRQKTQFWLVRPEISPERVENLDLLLTGPYITFAPGSGEYKDNFKILPEPPPQKPLRPGKEMLLTADKSGSLQRGAPVMYKSKRVGEVLDIDLDDELSRFEIPVYIYQPYHKLVSSDSVFWCEGGISVDASLKGIEIKSNSLGAILRGGISFTTPQLSRPLKSESSERLEFSLFQSYEDAVAASPKLQKPGYHFRLKTKYPKAYTVGTPIYYKKIKVGRVTGLQLSDDNKHVLLDCFIEQSYKDTVNSSSRFYDISGITFRGDFSGVSVETGALESLVSGGISFFTRKQTAMQTRNPTYPLYSTKRAAEAIDKIPVIVSFKDAGNLRQGSPVNYKGVEIGKVDGLAFSENMTDVLVTLSIDKKAATFFREGTRLWLEKAEVNLSGIKNLKNLIFGSYINILPGQGHLQRKFTALSTPPSTPAMIAKGLVLTLTSKHLGSLKIDSPVYYRQIQVGSVVDFRLSPSFENVHIRINIEKPYIPLIRENTRFWKASGAKIEGGLFSGLSVSTESLEALLTGGIALATPENSKMGSRVLDNHTFHLYEEAEDEWLDWQPSITLLKKEEGGKGLLDQGIK